MLSTITNQLVARWKSHLVAHDEGDDNPAGFIELPSDYDVSGGTGQGQTYVSTCTCPSTCSHAGGCTSGCTVCCTCSGCTDLGCSGTIECTSPSTTCC
jgi:hypothetical protein